jgi:hypothetical protein
MPSPVSAPARPPEVRRSLFWWWVAIGGVILGQLIGLFLPQQPVTSGGLTSMLLPGRSSGPLPAPSTGAIAISLVFAVVDLVVWIALVHNVGRGSNGARWWLTVLAAIEELVTFFTIVGDLAAPSVVHVLLALLHVVEFAAALAAIVFMHRPGARFYFQGQLT